MSIKDALLGVLLTIVIVATTTLSEMDSGKTFIAVANDLQRAAKLGGRAESDRNY